MRKLKLVLLVVFLLFLSVNLVACDESTMSDIDQDKMQIYTLATESGYEGTYEEWLDSLKAESISIDISNGYICWKYSSDTEWTNLVNIEDLIGTNGVDGADGTAGLDGIDGKEVEFNVSTTHIQYRYVGDTEWINLISLESLTGSDGIDGLDGADGINGKSAYELAVAAGYTGSVDEWLTTLIGQTGDDGESVVLTVDGTMIKWKLYGDTEWQDLFDLTTITPEDGIDGLDGEDGKEVEFNVSATHIQYRYEGDAEWINLISLSSLTGAAGTDGVDGKSAYELAVELGFEGTEEEWLDSLKGEDGNSIVDINISYGYDSDGNETITYVFVMSDGSEIVEVVIVPKKVMGINLYEPYYAVLNDGDELPSITVEVWYDDNSSEMMTLTEDMFESTDFFYEIGEHYVVITVDSYKWNGYITIYDPENIEIISISDISTTELDITPQGEEIPQLQMYARCYSPEFEYIYTWIDITEDMYESTDFFYVEGYHDVVITTANGYTYSFQIKIDDLSTKNVADVWDYTNTVEVSELGEELPTMMAYVMYEDGTGEWMTITEGMYDSTDFFYAIGEYEVIINLPYYSFTAWIRVVDMDNAEIMYVEYLSTYYVEMISDGDELPQLQVYAYVFFNDIGYADYLWIDITEDMYASTDFFYVEGYHDVIIYINDMEFWFNVYVDDPTVNSIISVWGLDLCSVELITEGDTLPELEIYVGYEDGTEELMIITEDMYVSAENFDNGTIYTTLDFFYVEGAYVVLVDVAGYGLYEFMVVVDDVDTTNILTTDLGDMTLEMTLEITSEGESVPSIYAYVIYGTLEEETILITEDMYASTDFFYTVGTHEVTINFDYGYTVTIEITIYDSENLAVVYMEICDEMMQFNNISSSLIITREQLENNEYLLVDYWMYIEYEFGFGEIIALDYSYITYDKSILDTTGQYNTQLTITYKGYSIVIDILLIDTFNTAEYDDIFALGTLDSLIYNTSTNEYILATVFFRCMYQDEEYYYYETVSKDQLTDIDFTQSGWYYQELWYGEYSIWVEVVIYSSSVIENYAYCTTYVSVNSTYEDVTITLDKYIYYYDINNNIIYETYVQTTAYTLTREMLSEDIDFSVAGTVPFECIIDGITYTLTIEIYDASVNNIKYLEAEVMYNYIDVNTSEEEFVEQLTSSMYFVEFYEEDPMYGNFIQVWGDELSFDYSEVVFGVAGEYTVYATTPDGFTFEFTITIN